MSRPYDFKCRRLSRTTENGPSFNTEGNGEPPLKKEILKIRFFHVRKGPNIGREPNFHDHRSSNVKDYPGQPKRQNMPKKRVFSPKKGVKSQNSKIGLRSALSRPKIHIE